MREILTIQLGHHANFTSAYFWQIQDAYQKEYEFYDSFFVQSPEKYYPRMIGIDWKESLSFPMPKNMESEILW